METIIDLIAVFKDKSLDFDGQVRLAREKGRKVVGCGPYFVPLELIHAAGMQPMELWEDEGVSGSASSYYPAFYCSLLFSLMNGALGGKYDELSAVIVPTTCDGLRNLEENWKFACPTANVIDYVQPVVRDTKEAHLYNRSQLKRIASKLEAITGEKITERALRESIVTYNAHRAAMRDFSMLSSRHTDIITPLNRRYVFSAARVMPVEEHLSMVRKLNDELLKMPECAPSGTSVVLTGIMADSPSFLLELEKNNMSVVGDLTVAESVRYEADVPGRIDPYDSLAEIWERVEGASIALDPQKKRGILLSNLAKSRGADGVIACIVKFCEAEEFDVPILKKQLMESDTPLLVLEVESQLGISEQIATRVQAFSEMLQLGKNF